MSKKALAGVSAAGSAVYTFVEFGLANIDILMSALVPLAYRIAPRVEWIPAASVEDVVIVLSVVVFLYSVYQIVSRAAERFT